MNLIPTLGPFSPFFLVVPLACMIIFAITAGIVTIISSAFQAVGAQEEPATNIAIVVFMALSMSSVAIIGFGLK